MQTWARLLPGRGLRVRGGVCHKTSRAVQRVLPGAAVLPSEIGDADPVARAAFLYGNNEGSATQCWDSTDHEAGGPVSDLAIAVERLNEQPYTHRWPHVVVDNVALGLGASTARLADLPIQPQPRVDARRTDRGQRAVRAAQDEQHRPQDDPVWSCHGRILQSSRTGSLHLKSPTTYPRHA